MSFVPLRAHAHARVQHPKHEAPMSWFKYVRHSEILVYLARGWSISDELHGTSHGNWSVLMRWDGEGEPG